MKRLIVASLATLVITSLALAEPPSTFTAAKAIAKNKVFYDQASTGLGDLYCGCAWKWVGKSGGRIDAASCGYDTRAQQMRAERIEWEHIVPAWIFGHQRQCWQNGGRKHCVADDPVFRAMEADLFNLYPSVGEVNGDRSNYQYGLVAGGAALYGACTTRVDFKARSAEPRDEVKGLVARSTFYMYDRYGLTMSRQQQQLLMAWDRQHPVSTWEREWDSRTAKVMGHHNPFITGERAWTLGHKPLREGLVSLLPTRIAAPPSAKAVARDVIIGNRNSRVYHLPQDCPSYAKVAPKNQEIFSNESAAIAAGYRKAGNCR